MRIELVGAAHALELTRFLRARGCIAYQVEGSPLVEALRPQAPATQERAELHELLAAWLADHPDSILRVTD